MTKKFIQVTILFLVFLSCNKPSEPIFDNVYDDQSDQYIPFADLSTNVVTQILAQSAVSGGQFANDYGKPVTQKGVCWSLVESPTVDGSCSQDGSGLSVFTSTLTGLVADTLYYVRAYATNADGTTYGQQLSFRTMDGKPVFSTPVVSGIGTRGASLSGSVSADGGAPILRRGFVWSLNSDPTTQDSVRVLGDGLGDMSITLNSLTPGATYYIRAFAESGTGVHYSDGESFVTLDGKPVFGQTQITGITSTRATISATISADGGESLTTRGICFGTQDNPTTQDNCVNSGSGTGSFSVDLTELNAETVYHVRAFAENDIGIHYSVGSSFETMDGRAVIGPITISGVTSNSVTVAASISSDGGEPVTGRGACYSTTQNPSTQDTCVSSGNGTGAFSVNIEGLRGETRYYVRAYAFNVFRITYSEQVEFNTTGIAPIVTTGFFSNITTTSATIAGNVSSQGSSAVTSRGICYSTTQYPTTANSCVASGSGNGNFSAILTGLTSGVRYYARAFATNNAGTSYGNQIEFVTAGTPPTVTTGAVSNINANSASVGGNVSSQGSSAVTARGVCVATTQNPTTASTCATSGSGTGAFTATLSGLTSGVRYYVRAFATNAAGTSYGGQVEFTTTGTAPTVTTGFFSNITTTGATVAGNVTSQGSSAVTARGVCYATTQNPTTASSCVTSGSGTGPFSANLTGLTIATRYYARAYATNSAGTSYGNQVEFTTSGLTPTVTTGVTSNITTNSATVAGNVTSQGSFTVTARGVVWSTFQNPTVSSNSGMATTGNGTGTFTSNLTGLNAGTRYYARAYATNSAGTSYGSQVEFTTTSSGGDANGRDNTTLVVDVRNPATGRTWMDRNLGASRVATSLTDTEAYGDLYQWGRRTDGHQKRNSSTTSTLSNTNTPNHGSFILAPDSPNDWRSPQNNSLWQGLNGVNNPCPVGYRIPTIAEWTVEQQSWTSNNSSGAFSSLLRLALGGSRFRSGGALGNVGTSGNMWSSSVSGSQVQYLTFDSGNADVNTGTRALGSSVRCIKDAIEVFAPTVQTTAVSSITTNTAVSGGNVTSGGGATVTARGVVWSTSQNPTVSSNSGMATTGNGTGTFTSNLTGLNAGTRYYVRAYATNSAGTSYGNQIEFTTTTASISGRDTETLVVDVRNPVTGRTWMDRNLGASRAATSSTDSQAYGDLYQWGRRADGHQKRNSSTTNSLSSTDTPSHGNFIPAPNEPYDWRSPQNNNLWQGVNGVNNPCPVGYRIPTVAEWDTERGSWGSNNATGAINSLLKLPMAGSRFSTGGSLFNVGSHGFYWSSFVDGSYAVNLSFNTTNATNGVSNRAFGYPVRCIKNTIETVSPIVQTTSVSSITTNSAVSGGNITSSGGATVTARGIVWGTSQNPTVNSNSGNVSSGSGTGTFTANLTGLSSGTRYYIRAYATNSAGTSYGNQIEFTTSSSSTSGRDTETVVLDVINPSTGRTWMDRNLGASRAATSSTDTQAYGDLYQWGRRADGHQKRNSSTTTTLSSTDTPSHGSFIIGSSDWRNPQNNNLWQGVNGVNNPCPTGYRIPTISEWNSERQSWTTNNSSGAISSPLKFPLAGFRGSSLGSVSVVGIGGYYWSTSTISFEAQQFYIVSTSAAVDQINRGVGQSVRCIKN